MGGIRNCVFLRIFTFTDDGLLKLRDKGARPLQDRNRRESTVKIREKKLS